MQRLANYPLLPSGVKDHLPEASERLRAVGQVLLGELGRWGYRGIVTPLYEYLSVLERGLGRGRRQQTFKFVEPQSGEVVALRPDITPQVARLYATRFADVNGPVRLWYEGRVVRFGRDGDGEPGRDAHGRSGRPGRDAGPREVFQVGVELLGRGGPEADAEVISLLIHALDRAGVPEFQIDLGQVEITRAVLDETGLGSPHRERVVALIARKDRSGLEALLGELSLPETARRALFGLTSLYGGPDVLDEAVRVVDLPAARAALDDLREVVRLLGEEGHAPRLTVDLGELRDFDYHDGLLFHAYVPGVGAPVAGGGRYDHLTERYGRAAEATGFAVDMEQLVAVLDRLGIPAARGEPRVLVAGPRREALALSSSLHRAGCRAARALGPTDLASASRLGFDFYARVDGADAEVRRLPDGEALCRPISEVPRLVLELYEG